MSAEAPLSELERHALAYFIAHEAAEFRIDPRFLPSRELTSIFETRFKFALENVGVTDRTTWENAAHAFVALVLACEGFSTIEHDDSVMHRFQRVRRPPVGPSFERRVLHQGKALKCGNPVSQRNRSSPSWPNRSAD